MKLPYSVSGLVDDNLCLYLENVLLSIVKQIVNCKYSIAHDVVANCVAQVFPADFQLATFGAFMRDHASSVRLQGLPLLEDKVQKQYEQQSLVNCFEQCFQTFLKPQRNVVFLRDRVVICH